MSLLRLIEPLPLQHIQSLLNDDNLKVKPIRVQYEDYVVNNEAATELHPLHFVWHYGEEGTEPLLFALDTWATKASLAAPGSYLKVGTEENHRIVGFSLPLVPQDDKYVYLGFKQGIGAGGKNRWFGRGDKKEDFRTDDTMRELTKKLRQTWHLFFPDALPEQHPKLSGDWLLLARLPLADLDPSASKVRRSTLKTLILKTIAQAFVIAEKLRDESLGGIEAPAISGATDSSFPSKMTIPLNQILYGPPGTGKTYHTAVRAIGLLKGLTDAQVTAAYPTREALRTRYNELRQTGRIQFVTFHQSFSYEDFVEGIKPVLNQKDLEESTAAIGYTIADGVFKTLANRSLYAVYWQQQHRLAAADDELPTALNFDAVFELFANHLRNLIDEAPENSPVSFRTKAGTEVLLQSVGTDGTAYLRYRAGNAINTLPVTRNGLRIIDEANLLVTPVAIQSWDFVVTHGRDRTVYRTLFREFWNFRNALEHPTIPSAGVEPDSFEKALQRVTAEPSIASEIIKRLDTQQLQATDYSAAPRFVLIIDEINRGNVANIFGELITLLEDDKRAGRPEALTVQLPYSKEDFTVPENLYLLGTMNTADRSVEALDTALRRRFSFTEMRPDAQVIRANVGNNGVIGTGAEAVDIARLLEVLNSRLEQLLDHDHCLGHALLLRLNDLDGLRAAFARNILPLLQEYFFGDWGKIGLVLGERFISVAGATERHALVKFGKYDTGGNVRDKPVYRLTSPETWDATAFQSIYPAASVPAA